MDPSSTRRPLKPPSTWARRWWRQQSPSRQDRFASMAPIAAVLLFFAAIVVAFGYLHLEEIDREQQTIKRDVEYAHQRLRLRLIEQQEQMLRLARDVNNGDSDVEDFTSQAESLINRYPELQAVTWLDQRQRMKASYASLAALTTAGDTKAAVGPLKTLPLEDATSLESSTTFGLVRDLRQPIYSRALFNRAGVATMQLQVPLLSQGRFAGVVLAEYNIDGLMRYGVPTDVASKYAFSFVDAADKLLAGNTAQPRSAATRFLPWAPRKDTHEVPVAPIGSELFLHGEAYRTSLALVGSGLFWLVGGLSLLTAWLLLGTWRHTRRRMAAQQALMTETNFRRAMENSMLTGMRALDLQGRITYVNPAFCQMTGWNESELVGRTAPFPYWPDEDREILTARLEDELQGRSTAAGFQVRVKRKNAKLFDARMYVSPLIDPRGQQTGWMTSMTDITEPNRVREQLAASHERFTTVLDALDASISVTPLGSEELLFANRMYRSWFGAAAGGHLQLVAQAGRPNTTTEDASDEVDGLAGLPTTVITTAAAENAEIFVEPLGKWLEVRSRYLTWVDGRLAQMVIASDITPRRTAEEQAATQADRAQTASRLITMGEMASSVAHELNQPLTAINNYCMGMVSRIKGEQISNDGLIEALGKTAHQAQRAGQIIQRIRSFVKRSEPNRVESDVPTMVAEALELAEIELRRRNVRISPYLAARLPQVMVDPILIEQVLINLLKNAGEAVDLAERPFGRRNVELRVVPGQVGDQSVIEFSVQDTGRGLAPEVMERLFTAFFSTKAEGMGIGLNLCRSIVESHQGRMQAENLYNGPEIIGCKFSFWLPVSGASSEAADSKNAALDTGVPP